MVKRQANYANEAKVMCSQLTVLIIYSILGSITNNKILND